jgi:AcrR family transcriptional regulator
MPRVSEQHLADRRQQILDAATRCFIANGFHQTSMQDLIRSAEVSVGTFYRYFRSKTELIRAIAEEIVGELVNEFDLIVNIRPVPALADAMRQALETAEKRLTGGQQARIAVLVWSEALRDPELAELVAAVYRTIRGRFVTLASRARDDGQLPAATDTESVGAALFGFLQGYVLQRLLVGNIDVTAYHAGLTGLLSASPAALSTDHHKP